MALKFSNRVAVITGAGKGIGFEIARQLIQEGACVALNDIDAKLAKEAAIKLVLEGPGKCVAIPGDASDHSFIHKLIRQTIHEYGHIEMAIANAGTTLFGDFFELKLEDFQKVVNLNLQGSFFLAQQAATQMRMQGGGGRILLMSSTIGLRAYPHLAIYSMTKSALHMMAKSLVLDLSPYDITINALAPGATITERTLLEDPDYENCWRELIPNGKTAMPSDIAKAALFLLSGDAGHITGQTLVIDGGWTAISPYPDSFDTLKNNLKEKRNPLSE
jgi:3-oxoacyl-[acyl-carrier protein] reductase